MPRTHRSPDRFLRRSPIRRVDRAHPVAILPAVALLAMLPPSPAVAGSSPAPAPALPVRSAPAPAGAVWPLDPQPEVVEDFTPPASRWGAGHRGVDLLGSVGQVVRAAKAGTVTYAARLAGRGVVVVSHGVTRTTYEPVTASVRRGDRVTAGSPIGRLELFGSHCLPQACLHWGLLEGEQYLDPLTLVGAGPVRLLPWSGGGSLEDLVPDGPVPQLPGWQPLGDAALFRA